MRSLATDTKSDFETAIAIIKLLAKYNPLLDTSDENSLKSLPVTATVNNLVSRGLKIQFILPAFPAKSPNRNKTLGNLPDMGEVIALSRLHKMCVDINDIYLPGAKVIICSDGRVFNDLVRVSDEHLVNYKNEISTIIEDFGLEHLTQFSLDDCYHGKTFQSMRQDLTNQYGPSLESVKHLVQTKEHFKTLFNGMHKFLKEDLSPSYPSFSKNYISSIAKEVTYEVMRRSNAWDQLLKNYFHDVVRLSIHPYSPLHHKFTIQLIPSMSHWATPWHNVVLKRGQVITLIKKQEAMRMGASLKFFKDRYGFFEI
jgi:pyoverdine/dityrosine biosynthesis protein Dit1